MNRIKFFPVFALLTAAFCFVTFSSSPITARELSQKQTLSPRVRPNKPAVTKLSAGAKFESVIVKFDDAFSVRMENGRLGAATADIAQANARLAPYLNGRLNRLFRTSSVKAFDQKRSALQKKSGKELADLNNYYEISVRSIAEAEGLINDLNALDIVELAYVQPIPEVAEDKDPPTPDYSPNQSYRLEAPKGVDAVYANTLPGGDGSGVKVVDIEYAWQMTHEDLENSIGGIIGDEVPFGMDSHHGTAVIGEMIGTDNGYGVTGICPGADIGMVSVANYGTSNAILLAADSLEAGDLILIELHAPGPRYDFASREDQAGYICMEYWQDNFDAIVYASAKGIVVVEAAGNGGEDFDDVIYENRFDTTYRNSHAIIAGAAGPWSWPEDLQRLDFSNYGERVNLQGYGRGVYTTGYGELFAPNDDIDQYYTALFSGTSSASPIVTGAAACLQGRYKAIYNRVLTADQIRTILTQSGTPQLGNTSEHIGPRPDLNAAFQILPVPSDVSVSPSLVKATATDGETAQRTFWLRNHSPSTSINYNITDDDGGELTDWLQITPTAGSVPSSDSILIQVTMDATAISGRLDPFIGSIDVAWGTGSLDSSATVAAYFSVLCNDQTYHVISSTKFGAPAYEWVSAYTLGTKIDEAAYYAPYPGFDSLDDGTAGPFPIGFDVEFYGNTYTQYYVGVNGAISFTDQHINVGGYYSAGLTIPGEPFITFISPFWNDLLIEAGAKTDAGIYRYTSPTSDTTVVEWFHLSNFNNINDRTADFAVMLLADGSINFLYDNVGSSGLDGDALIGVAELDCKALGYYTYGNPTENKPISGERIHISTDNYVEHMAGDANGSGSINIADVTYLIEWLFGVPNGPPPNNMWLADANCSGGNVNISDITYLVAYLFGIPPGDPPCQVWIVE